MGARSGIYRWNDRSSELTKLSANKYWQNVYDL